MVNVIIQSLDVTCEPHTGIKLWQQKTAIAEGIVGFAREDPGKMHKTWKDMKIYYRQKDNPAWMSLILKSPVFKYPHPVLLKPFSGMPVLEASIYALRKIP